MKDNEMGWVCTWCDEEVEEVKPAEHGGERPTGRCEDDGIVYVEQKSEEVES